MNIVLAMLVVAVAVRAANEVETESESQMIVAARVVSCPGCGLNRRPTLKAFLKGPALSEYGAVELNWDWGHNPDLQLLNKFQRVVETRDLMDLDGEQIHALLAKYGIKRGDAARPVFLTRILRPTEVCSAWRQTLNCSPAGPRAPLDDSSCHMLIDAGRSGYCQCIDRPDVGFACHHRESTCETECSKSVPP
jgi:hypothetical protein